MTAAHAKPPVVTGGITFGATPGGGGKAVVDAMVAALDPTNVREYQDAMGLYVPLTLPHMFSRPVLKGGTFAAALAAAAKLPDVPGLIHYVGVDHEYNIAPGATPAAHQRNQAAWIAGVRGINRSRKQPLLTQWIATGSVMHGGMANMDPWYVPVDRMGWDIYDPHVIPLCAAYAQVKGKPWDIGELGLSVHYAGTDDELVTAMDYMVGLLRQHYPPGRVDWYNGGLNRIVGGTRPKAVARWLQYTGGQA